MLVDFENNNSIRFRSGGFFPRGGAEKGGRVEALASLESNAVFPCATYPVSANSSSVFMTRADMWRRFRGFDASLSRAQDAAADYGVRAAIRGYVHFCTSAISATVVGQMADAVPSINLPNSSPPWRWREVASTSVIMKRLLA